MTTEPKCLPECRLDQKTIDRFWSKVDRSGDCWLWKGSLTPKGYGHFYAFGSMTKAHRVSWLIYGGDIPTGAFVCHRCDNPRCVNPNHLFIGNHEENMADMYRKGRGHLKVTQAQVEEIRMKVRNSPRHQIGMRKALASHYGISASLLKKIIENKLRTEPSRIHA